MLRVYPGAVHQVLNLVQYVGDETDWNWFRCMVKRLSTLFALTMPREETTEITPRLVFFQRIAAMICSRLANAPGPTPGRDGYRDINAAVGQVIGDAVDAGEVAESATQAGVRSWRTR